MNVAQLPIERPSPEKLQQMKDNYFAAHQHLNQLKAEKKNTVSGYNDEIRDQRKYIAELERMIEEAPDEE